MRAPIYLAFCAAAWAAALPLDGAGLETVDVAADPETINYLLPKLAAKYRPSAEWRDVTDPRFYVLTEMDSNEIDNNQQSPAVDDQIIQRKKRQSSRIGDAGGSLSIVNSLDVLRNRLLLEIARKKAKEGANRNRQLLMNFGKRGFAQRQSGMYLPRRILTN
ncbi:unnamed protein product [Ceutorhynchus assimilis]|uniref:Corticotropin-releasing factor domain-containing protein n=1 Tax=Ceutorhynchus assimilis TaxID=467358 RepID=A0A9N9QSB5_9CUCU|nr:unnamed protein product [Ceutorhynchus assimilis]